MMDARKRLLHAATALAATALAATAFSCSLPDASTNRYALVYGVADYRDFSLGSGDLTFTDDDAEGVAAALTAGGWTVKHLRAGSVIVGSEGDASKAAIKSDISSLLDLDSDASILMYFSGHGDADGSEAYIIPWDGTYANRISPTAADLETWISATELNSWISAIPARNQVLILDTCYSGGFVSAGKAVDTAPANYGSGWSGDGMQSLIEPFPGTALVRLSELLSRNASGAGGSILALSAAGSRELSWEESRTENNLMVGNGIFTYALIESARKADTDGDHLVTMSEAYAWSAISIQRQWNTTNPGNAYYPHISGTARDIVLFDNR